MNRNLIEKVIKSNNEPCSELEETFENPLLNRNVARALSKSFVNLLNVTNQATNKNIRHSILDNIRKLCRVTCEGHLKVNENLTDSLKEVYQKYTEEKVNRTQGTDQSLDAHLLRQVKEIQVDSKFESIVNPEVIQSLINLHEGGVYLDTLSKDILHWDTSNPAFLNIAKDLWNNNTKITESNTASFNILDDVSLKIKSDIEKILLSSCYEVLCSNDKDINDFFADNNKLNTLVVNCSKSAICFQLSCSVLNFLFVMTSFASKIQEFIQIFVCNVKDNCLFVSFSVLYPIQLSHVVVLLDLDLNELSGNFKKEYLSSTVNYLKDIQNTREYDFIMLISHYPQWFDVYFDIQSI